MQRRSTPADLVRICRPFLSELGDGFDNRICCQARAEPALRDRHGGSR